MSTTKYSELENKTFYKITNATECHYDFQYKDELNVLTDDFAESGSCVTGGFYFTDIHHIFQFLDYGCYLRIVELQRKARLVDCSLERSILPLTDPDFKCVKDGQNKWRSNKIILKDKMDLWKATTFEYLKKQGADIRADNDYAVGWASRKGHLEVVKFLVEHGANVRANNDYAVRSASQNGHLEVVKFLVSKGSDIRAKNDKSVKYASQNGKIDRSSEQSTKRASRCHLTVVKFLVEKGADIKADNNYAVKYASENGHLTVVKSLVEQGADIREVNDALKLAQKEVI